MKTASHEIRALTAALLMWCLQKLLSLTFQNEGNIKGGEQ